MPDWIDDAINSTDAVLREHTNSSDCPRRRLVEGQLCNASRDIDYCLQLTWTAHQKDSS